MEQSLGKLNEKELVNFFEHTPHLGKCAAHFKVPIIQVWRHAKKLGLKPSQRGGKLIPLEEVLNGDHPYYQTGKLKRQILKHQTLPYECVECGVTEWHGKELSLHLDHINGDGSDHRIQNLRFLCPNCHSQTDTYCGRNKGRCPSG